MADAPALVVVANPVAGHGKAGRLIGKVTTGLHRLRLPHEIRVSESGPDLERLARVAAEGGARIVAAQDTSFQAMRDKVTRYDIESPKGQVTVTREKDGWKMACPAP